MTTTGRRGLIILPLLAMVGLLWGAVELARVVSTYYLVVGLLPLPAMLLMLGYFTALLWHDGASPNAMKHQ